MNATSTRLLTVVVVAFVALGALLPARGLFVVLRPGEGGATPDLAVTVVDISGAVIGVEESLVDAGPGSVAGVPGRPNAIVYTWDGGLCDRAASIRVERGDGTISLYRTDEERRSTGSGCLLAAIRRSVVIEFREPVDPAAVIDLTNVLF